MEKTKDFIEPYPKSCVILYKDGWYITFVDGRGLLRQGYGPYKIKALSEHDRRNLNEIRKRQMAKSNEIQAKNN